MYEEALTVLPTPAMHRLYCTFLQERLRAVEEQQGQGAVRLKGASLEWAEQLLAAHTRAFASGGPASAGVFKRCCLGTQRVWGCVAWAPVGPQRLCCVLFASYHWRCSGVGARRWERLPGLKT